jgi:hypothetical protein
VDQRSQNSQVREVPAVKDRVRHYPTIHSELAHIQERRLLPEQILSCDAYVGIRDPVEEVISERGVQMKFTYTRWRAVVVYHIMVNDVDVVRVLLSWVTLHGRGI